MARGGKEGGGLPSAQLNNRLANVRSGNTRATNISSNEHLSPVVNNVTDQGLSVVFPEDGKPKDNSQITF